MTMICVTNRMNLVRLITVVLLKSWDKLNLCFQIRLEL